VKKSESQSFKMVGGAISQVVPNLERFNWRSAPIYDVQVPFNEILASAGYCLGWTVFLVSLTALIFRRRDFV
jgi:ABC-type transport system involved in multi-copper enzyme maturation permease subunit